MERVTGRVTPLQKGSTQDRLQFGNLLPGERRYLGSRLSFNGTVAKNASGIPHMRGPLTEWFLKGPAAPNVLRSQEDSLGQLIM
jgi:hypothetical protein